MRKIIIFIILINLLNSCQSVTDGFKLKKKDGADEFLVEKKNPLTVPIDINELPVPLDEEEQNQTNAQEDIDIKKVLQIDENETSNSESNDENQDTIKSILEKINN